MNGSVLTAALAATFAAGLADLAILNLAIAPAAFGADGTDTAAEATPLAEPDAPVAAPPDRSADDRWAPHDREPAAGEAERAAFRIHFDAASASLRRDARPTLQEVARRLGAHPTLDVAIRGHADRRGTDTANERVSTLRAEAAAAYLEEAGVDRARMRVSAHGAAEPLSHGIDPASLAENRRVELELYGGER